MLALIMTRPIDFERFIVSPSRFLEFPLIYHYIVALGTIAKGSLLFDIHDHAVLVDADTRDCPQLSVQVREGAVWQWLEVEFLHETWQFVTDVSVEGEAFHYLDSSRRLHDPIEPHEWSRIVQILATRQDTPVADGGER
jgi:hypothetical protein